MAIETPGGKRNLNKNINAQQAILNAYITNNSSLYKIYSANVSLLHRNIIRAMMNYKVYLYIQDKYFHRLTHTYLFALSFVLRVDCLTFFHSRTEFLLL